MDLEGEVRKPLWNSQVKMDLMVFVGPELVICLNMDSKIIGKKDWFNWVGDLKQNFFHGNHK